MSWEDTIKKSNTEKPYSSCKLITYVTKNDETMAVPRDGQGDIQIDCQDHSILCSFLTEDRILPRAKMNKKNITW